MRGRMTTKTVTEIIRLRTWYSTRGGPRSHRQRRRRAVLLAFIASSIVFVLICLLYLLVTRFFIPN